MQGPEQILPWGRSPTRTISKVTERDRHIPFEACFNCRDLGGYATNDGRLVRWGVVFRSGSLHRLTTADLETAKDLASGL